jgi:hypothetical protein
MSNFDDAASRRDRGNRGGGQDWRSHDNGGRDDRRPAPSQQRDYRDYGRDEREGYEPQRPASSFSGFSRHQYEPQRGDPPPRQPVTDDASQHRRFEPQQPEPFPFPSSREPERDHAPAQYAPRQPEPPQPPQGYYEERNDLYERPASPPQRGGDTYGNNGYYEQNAGFGQRDAFYPDPNADRRTLIETAGRTPNAPLEQHPHLARQAPSAQDEYERNFAARLAAQAHEPPATSRFYLPQDPPPARSPHDDPFSQHGLDRGYGETDQRSSFQQNDYLSRPVDDRAWDRDSFDGGQPRTQGLGQVAPYDDGRSPLDADYFGDEDEFADDHQPQPKKSRKLLIAASLGGALAVGGGGAYVYKTMIAKPGPSSASAVITADTRPTKELPADAGGRQFPNANKAIYKRLTEDGSEVNATAPAPSASGPRFPAPAPAAAPSGGGSSLEDRIEEALKRAQRPGDPKPSFSASPAPGRAADQPTVVRSETYRPDGTRMSDGNRVVVTAGSGNASQGQLPPPFNTSPAPGGFAPSPAPVSGPRVAAAAPAPAPASAPAPAAAPVTRSAAPAPAATKQVVPASAYSVQLGASQDEKAAALQLTSLSEKYASVLGSATMTTKTVDLGAKGVWFRNVAGPLDSAEAAAELCKQLKAAGQKDCIVRKPE